MMNPLNSKDSFADCELHSLSESLLIIKRFLKYQQFLITLENHSDNPGSYAYIQISLQSKYIAHPLADSLAVL